MLQAAGSLTHGDDKTLHMMKKQKMWQDSAVPRPVAHSYGNL